MVGGMLVLFSFCDTPRVEIETLRSSRPKQFSLAPDNAGCIRGLLAGVGTFCFGIVGYARK